MRWHYDFILRQNPFSCTSFASFLALEHQVAIVFVKSDSYSKCILQTHERAGQADWWQWDPVRIEDG